MSMHPALPMETVSGNAYVVAAPRPCDALSAALRRAFMENDRHVDPFADVVRQLDMIDMTR